MLVTPFLTALQEFAIIVDVSCDKAKFKGRSA